MSSSRLFDLARILDLPLVYFFKAMAAAVEAQTPSKLLSTKKLPTVDQENDPIARRETQELVRAYYGVSDSAARRRIFELTKSVAKAGGQ